MKVSCAAGEISGRFQQALIMLQRAYAPGMADETFAMLMADVARSHALLWVAHEDARIYGAACTSIVTYPNGRKVCVIRACAGREFAKWHHTLREIEQYAKDMNCAAVRLSGRRGWQILKADGYREPWIMLEKEL